MDIDSFRALGVGKSAVESLPADSLPVDSLVEVAAAADKISVDILLVDGLVMAMVDMIDQDSLLEDFDN